MEDVDYRTWLQKLAGAKMAEVKPRRSPSWISIILVLFIVLALGFLQAAFIGALLWLIVPWLFPLGTLASLSFLQWTLITWVGFIFLRVATGSYKIIDR